MQCSPEEPMAAQLNQLSANRAQHSNIRNGAAHNTRHAIWRPVSALLIQSRKPHYA